ncbi:MAG: TonB-dependent receptor plug domain-containing protein [Phenylobacterium sp.]|uniref:TonB-dependent receptor plug domain-containing protein n=1 Tax=Phenylobacterium sp. TaxID=1871053 RepID=UPI00391909A8
MKTLLISTACLAACAAAAGQAKAADAPADVDELVVTATRSPQRADKIGQSVTVLNAEAIEASQAVVLSDLLARTPGVTVSRNGGVGGATTVRIRGAEGDQTLVVVDGVKVNDPSLTGGGYDFANLLVGDVARIEVLRGAHSTLWGSQAIGGVVNIVTAEPSAPLEGRVQAEVGSMDTRYLRAAIGGAGERVSWRLAAGRYETDGVSAYRGGAEADGYENTRISGRARLSPAEGVVLDLRATWSKSRNEFDGFPPPTFSFGDTAEYGEAEELVGYAGLEFDMFEGALRNRVAYGYTRTDRDLFDPAQAPASLTFTARGENRRWEYQGVWAVAEGWNATFGAETEKSEMRTAAPWDLVPTRAAATLDGVYAQLQGELAPGLTLTAGLRRDEHDAFGGRTLGQLAAAWSLNEGATILRASFGQGFKAPSLYQLYSEYGNEALRPEAADSWDAGIEQRLLDGRLVLTATWFQRETENQIDFFSCAATNQSPICFRNGVRRFGAYDNIARAKARGVELDSRLTLGGLRLEANYTWTDTENDSVGANHGKQLARRPEHQANLGADYEWESGLSAGANVRYVGKAFDNAANTGVLESHTLVDLRAAFPLSERVEIHGRVENLFDETYETARNYGAPGRAAYVGVRARF